MFDIIAAFGDRALGTLSVSMFSQRFAMTQAPASGKDQAPVQVGAADLPLHCPGPRAPLWSMHPRVFLDVTRTGAVNCPYCGTHYQLAAGTVVHGH
jgi:uncharacterized Zn-finger protein